MSKHDFKLFLQSFKLKATPHRVHLLEFLSLAKRPMSIKQIHQAIGSRSLNQATIYRTLETFKVLGVVRQVDFLKDYAYYELAGGDHHHIMCTNCGRIEDFRGCNIENIVKLALKQTKQFSVIQDHSLELFGICKGCLNKNNSHL